jgi:cytidyltransferase-like protein
LNVTINVYVDMIGDLFHAGHVRFLAKARSMGDRLIVGVSSDEIAESYKRTPILTLSERAEVVAGCRYVDLVIPGAPAPLTEGFLHEHAIDLVVHGDDFDPVSVDHWYGEAIRLGMFRTVAYSPGISTTAIIERIRSRDW